MNRYVSAEIATTATPIACYQVIEHRIAGSEYNADHRSSERATTVTFAVIMNAPVMQKKDRGMRHVNQVRACPAAWVARA